MLPLIEEQPLPSRISSDILFLSNAGLTPICCISNIPDPSLVIELINNHVCETLRRYSPSLNGSGIPLLSVACGNISNVVWKG